MCEQKVKVIRIELHYDNGEVQIVEGEDCQDWVDVLMSSSFRGSLESKKFEAVKREKGK